MWSPWIHGGSAGATSSTITEKSWAFASPAGASGTFYAGGFYEYGSLDNDFDPAINFGTANASKAAHFFIVLGAQTVDELTIRITGTSINDNGVRTASDTQDIVIPTGASVNNFYETSKKWLGQVTIEVISGTPKTCNYGFNKYWDNRNSNFRVVGFEATFRGGANDANGDIIIRHHKSTGWTFNTGSTPTPPAALASMSTDHSTEKQFVNGEYGAWKRVNLNTLVLGGADEGTIIEVITSANKAIDIANFILSIRPA